MRHVIDFNFNASVSFSFVVLMVLYIVCSGIMVHKCILVVLLFIVLHCHLASCFLIN